MIYPLYRIRPRDVRAAQFDGTPEGAREMHAWSGCKISEQPHFRGTFDSVRLVLTLIISTRSGLVTAGEGDWILRSEAGDFAALPDGLFQAAYERVEEGEGAPSTGHGAPGEESA